MNDAFDFQPMTIEVDDPWLHKKLNYTRPLKGGSSSIASLPSWLQGPLSEAVGGAANAAESGDFSNVAGFADEQRAALSQAPGIAQDQDRLARQGQSGVNTLESIASGEGAAYDRLRSSLTDDANLAEGEAAKSGGPLAGGSARSDRARAFGRARLGGALAQQQTSASQALQGAVGANQAARAAGATTLANAGQARQAQQQKENDAEYTKYQRLFGLFSSVPHGQTSKNEGGK